MRCATSNTVRIGPWGRVKAAVFLAWNDGLEFKLSKIEIHVYICVQ